MKKLLTLIFIICPTLIWENVDFVLFRNDGTKQIYTISEHGGTISGGTEFNGYFTDAEYTGGTEKSVTTGSGYYTTVR